MEIEHTDVVIVGAGLSGIGAAARLRMDHPGRSFLVLESRERLGGTWDLFRYPGVRSDSDMFTLGYSFRPWTRSTSMADGADIREYVAQTAVEYGVTERIRYSHRVVSASWDTATALWTLQVETPEGEKQLTCDLFWCCAGYYDYAQGYAPRFPGQDDYAGELVHPQHWPEDLDWTDRRIAVIGSGATAVTLVPVLAERAAEVTMVQRTPSYVLSLTRREPLYATWVRWLGRERAARLIRRRNIVFATALYRFCQRYPTASRRLIRRLNAAWLPPEIDVDTHFNPPYGPWDQRLCLVPDTDLFRRLREGSARIVTGAIETFTPTGLRMTDGTEVPADLVITATGLNLKVFGGIEVQVDGERIDPADTMAYRALMLSGVPNFVYTIGYTNASWTLKADLVAEYVSRLLRHMDERGLRRVVPVRDPEVGEEPFLDFEAGYVLRSLDTLPSQGDREPWRLEQNYRHDVRTIRRSRIDDPALSFS